MGKTETSGEHEGLYNVPNKELRIEHFPTAKRYHPLKELLNSQEMANAVFECLENNDPDGAMEMIEIYLEAVNKAKHMRDTKLPKSTMYSAFKHRNPTLKTLAKIMYKSTQE